MSDHGTADRRWSSPTPSRSVAPVMGNRAGDDLRPSQPDGRGDDSALLSRKRKAIGATVRAVRRAKQIPIECLAAQTDISIPELRAIEAGRPCTTGDGLLKLELKAPRTPIPQGPPGGARRQRGAGCSV